MLATHVVEPASGNPGGGSCFLNTMHHKPLPAYRITPGTFRLRFAASALCVVFLCHSIEAIP
jgi:hypothetical protein